MEFHDPIVHFSLVMAIDKDPKDLLSRIIHEWQRRLIKVKEIQSFESNMILAFYNTFTATPKKYLLQESQSILKEAQIMVKEIEPTDFFWTMEDLLSNYTLPTMGLCLQDPTPQAPGPGHFPLQQIELEGTSQLKGISC